MSSLSITKLVGTIVLVAISIILHEISHGFVAYKLGDPTAKNSGRLTLNPLKHIDPFGTLFLPALMSLAGGPAFGYAKPVPYNPRYFKNIRQGELLVGLAGPCSNLLQAFFGVFLFWLTSHFSAELTEVHGGLFLLLRYFASLYVYVNLVLMFFNLIPLPPLDGSSIIAPFLSDRALAQYYSIQQYSMAILLAAFFLIPALFHIDVVGMYINATAGNMFDLLMGR